MPLTISYYAHAWQAFVMIIAGFVSVIAAFAGYVQSGGGEELFRRALSNVGAVSYADQSFNWREGEVVFRDVRKKDFKVGEGETAEFSGIMAKEVRLKMDLFPWPPNITSITVVGMPETTISVSEGFLQTGRLRQLTLPEELPTINFQDCDLNFTIGKLQPLKLTGCGGEIKRSSTGQMRGNFSLSKLNEKPFSFKLESLDDGRWVFTGDDMQINTREAISGQTGLFSDKLDPVSFLVRALFTAELGAEGRVSSLKIVVQPASDNRKFTCDGEVGYQNLELKLPLPEHDAGQAVPYFLGQLIGVESDGPGDRAWRWPRWMQVDKIRTGQNGRVAFHMSEGVLNFSCDEGPGSGFVGSRKGREFPPLENLKGSVESDVDGKPHRITLRGFLGNQLDFETRIERNNDGARMYELILEPRSGDSQRVVFGKPLWRFISRVNDLASVKDAPTLANFEIEADARHFPIVDWLPPGMQDLSGHIYAKGLFTRDNKLTLESLSLDDGGSIVYGGPDLRKQTQQPGHFVPLWSALRGIFGSDSAWALQDLAIQGQAEVQFTPDLQWQSTKLTNWKITSGQILHRGLTTDVGVAQLQFSAQHKKNGDGSEIEVSTGLPNVWEAKFAGKWSTPKDSAPNGTFTLTEKDVPLLLHPLRETLSGPAVSTDKRRVNRTTTARVKDDTKPDLEVRP